MCFEHIFCGVLVWHCPALKTALCVGLCSELDCGTGTGKECCSIPWAAAAQRDISNSITHLGHQQLHEEGGKRKLLHHVAQVWFKH